MRLVKIISIKQANRSNSRRHSLKLSSKDIITGGLIAEKFVAGEKFGFGCAGNNEIPIFWWRDVPADTKELAFTVFDPDAPTGCGFWHWIVINISPKATRLDAAPLQTAKQLRNDFGTYEYGGPCPPAGDLPHRYLFNLYALSDRIEATKDTPAAQIGFQLNFKTIAKASVLGLYARD